MNNCVYILLCANDRYYVGSTFDLHLRLHQHISAQVKSTKNVLPLKLVFFQSYKSLLEARKVEFWLKKQKDKNFLKKIIREGCIQKQF